jgi:hypothetical protein
MRDAELPSRLMLAGGKLIDDVLSIWPIVLVLFIAPAAIVVGFSGEYCGRAGERLGP